MIFLLLQNKSKLGEVPLVTIIYTLFMVILLAIYVTLILSYNTSYSNNKLVEQNILIRAELCVKNNFLSSDLSQTCFLSNNLDYVSINFDGTEYLMNKHLINLNTKLKTEIISLTKDNQLKLVKIEYFIGKHDTK